jgi:hypothetical protein
MKDKVTFETNVPVEVCLSQAERRRNPLGRRGNVQLG